DFRKWSPTKLLEKGIIIKGRSVEPIGIKNAFKELYEKMIKEVPEKLDLDALNSWLMRFTLFVPSISPTGVNKGAIPDISLYDHSRLTGAISIAILRALQRGLIKKNELKENPSNVHSKCLSIIGGDLSGIQSYISSTPERYAIRVLKSNSMRLQLLSEAISRYIVEELHLSQFNVIFNSGGVFYILSHKISDDEFSKIKEKVYRSVSSLENGKIFVSLAKIDVSPSELQTGTLTNGEDMLLALHIEMGVDKGLEKSKTNPLFLRHRDVEYDPEFGYRACDICGSNEELSEIGEERPLILCKNHRKVLNVSEKMKKARYLRVGNSDNGDFVFKIDGRTFSYEFLEDGSADDFSINPHITGSEWNKFVFLPIMYPLDSNGRIRSIDDLTEESKKRTGFKKYGMLKGDVDSLGDIISRGFGRYKSMSRISFVSTLFNIFFSGIVPKLMHDEMKLFTKEKKGLDNPRTKIDLSREIYLVYSGGDDLLLIGPWDTIYKFSERIYEEFRVYTCWNPSVTMSMSIELFDTKFKIRRAFEICTDSLEMAKETKAQSLREYMINKGYIGPRDDLDLEKIVNNRDWFCNRVSEYLEEVKKKYPDQFAYIEEASMKHLCKCITSFVDDLRRSQDLSRMLKEVPKFLRLCGKTKCRISIFGIPVRMSLIKGQKCEFEKINDIAEKLIELYLREEIGRNTFRKLFSSADEIENSLREIEEKEVLSVPEIYRVKYRLKEEWNKSEIFDEIWKLFVNILEKKSVFGLSSINLEILRLSSRICEIWTKP
ncbi:type III-A CRISPR-associated protein Cas10/Csm1, partial [Candidatus Bathyarchaeota archaeon]